ncbi:MAG: endonuclease [Gemmatimonadaceae bacterium]|nr:endonuclease [Chitinophagaceae bacterium]
MPEGPSIVILKEEIQSFKRKKIKKAGGNAKVELERLNNKTILDIKSWGKHLLICFDKFYIRIHLLMFGSYRVNEKKASSPRLSLQFSKGELNFYACSVQIIDGNPDEVYDWTGDIMSPSWNDKSAIKKIRQNPEMLVCDALLDQAIFAGSGNIIKNEVLFRIALHPKSKLGKLPLKYIRAIVSETVNYSFDFLNWKKAFVLKKHWLAHTKKSCPRCKIPLHKEYPGKTKRRSFFCNNCQKLFA